MKYIIEVIERFLYMCVRAKLIIPKLYILTLALCKCLLCVVTVQIKCFHFFRIVIVVFNFVNLFLKAQMFYFVVDTSKYDVTLTAIVKIITSNKIIFLFIYCVLL